MSQSIHFDILGVKKTLPISPISVKSSLHTNKSNSYVGWKCNKSFAIGLKLHHPKISGYFFQLGQISLHAEIQLTRLYGWVELGCDKKKMEK